MNNDDDGFLQVEMGLPHFEIAPTDAKLKSDCIKLAEHMTIMWQGDVQFLVIATRKDESFNYAFAGTITDLEKQKRILEEVKKKTPDTGQRASEIVLGDRKL